MAILSSAWLTRGCFSVAANILGVKCFPKYCTRKSIVRDTRQFCSDLNTGSSNRFSLPEYNYGLEGKGKGFPRPKGRCENVDIRGEILFGLHPVKLALRARRRTIHRLFVKAEKQHRSPAYEDILRLCEERGVAKCQRRFGTLSALSGNRPHQGVCLDASRLPITECSEEDMKIWLGHSNSPLWLLLYEVKDPMNLGSALRSAHYLGADRVFITKKESAGISPVVSKASSGAMEVMDLSYVSNTVKFLQDCKKQNCVILGTTCKDNISDVIDVRDYELKGPTLVVVGNEARGLTDEIENICDSLVTINIPRSKPKLVDSLNVSVATGIVLHSLRKSRNLIR